MNELNATQEQILAECFEAMDAGAPVDVLLGRHPKHADALRPYLELRSELLQIDRPEPSAAYDAGLSAFRDRLNEVRSPEQQQRGFANVFGLRWGRPLVSEFGIRWKIFTEGIAAAPLARAGMAAAVLVLIGGGALGASAAGGFQPSRDVLSALRVIEDEPDTNDVAPPGSVPGDTRDDPDDDARDDDAPAADDQPSGDADQRPASNTPKADHGTTGGATDGGAQDTKDDAGHRLVPDVKDVVDTIVPVKPTPTRTPAPNIVPAPDDLLPPIGDIACDELSNLIDIQECKEKRNRQQPGTGVLPDAQDSLDDLTETVPSLP